MARRLTPCTEGWLLVWTTDRAHLVQARIMDCLETCSVQGVRAPEDGAEMAEDGAEWVGDQAQRVVAGTTITYRRGNGDIPILALAQPEISRHGGTSATITGFLKIRARQHRLWPGATQQDYRTGLRLPRTSRREE